MNLKPSGKIHIPLKIASLIASYYYEKSAGLWSVGTEDF